MLNYPLIFEPVYIEKIWGGNRLNSVFHKDSPFKNTGESWEVSAVKGNTSIVKNGVLKGKSLRELCRDLPHDLMGKRITEKYDGEFPLLIKFLDAQVPLSVQVHPNDDLAKIYDSFGKNEMWYILDAGPKSAIYLGFENEETKESVREALHQNQLLHKIKSYHPKNGDVYSVPAGTVHAIGGGVLLAEIQQTSDITFRMYDWDRKDADGNERALHLEESLDALNYKNIPDLRTTIQQRKDEKLVHNQFFKVNQFTVTSVMEKNTKSLDSFVIYMNLKGNLTLKFRTEEMDIEEGRSILIPYNLGNYEVFSNEGAEVLEVFV